MAIIIWTKKSYLKEIILQEYDTIKSFMVEDELKPVAFNIDHSGKAGELYHNPDTKSIWWVSSKSDLTNQYSDAKEIKKRFLDIEGIDHVIVNVDKYPPDNEGWQEVKYKGLNNA